MSKFLTIPQWYDTTGALCTGYGANVGNANTPVYVKDGQVIAANGGLGGFTFYQDSSNRLSLEQQNGFDKIYNNFFKIAGGNSTYKVSDMISDVTRLPEGGWFLNNKTLAGPLYLHISIIENRPSITSGAEKVIWRIYNIEYTELNGEGAHMQFQLSYQNSSLLSEVYLMGANGTAIMTYGDPLHYDYVIAYMGNNLSGENIVVDSVKCKNIELATPTS